MNFEEIINKIYSIPESSMEKLKEIAVDVEFPKGYILLTNEKVETSLYFINKGIARAYASTENGEVTFWFGKEGDAVMSMKSYIEGEKGYENIELLENCKMKKFNIQDLEKLFQEDIHIANFGRKLAEKEIIKTEEQLIPKLFKTASERYKDLMKNNPDLIQRVQLGHIASYLGITQVSLSRIRAEIR